MGLELVGLSNGNLAVIAVFGKHIVMLKNQISPKKTTIKFKDGQKEVLGM